MHQQRNSNSIQQPSVQAIIGFINIISADSSTAHHCCARHCTLSCNMDDMHALRSTKLCIAMHIIFNGFCSLGCSSAISYCSCLAVNSKASTCKATSCNSARHSTVSSTFFFKGKTCQECKHPIMPVLVCEFIFSMLCIIKTLYWFCAGGKCSEAGEGEGGHWDGH